MNVSTMKNKNKLGINRNDIIELASQLRMEHLFIVSERKNIQLLEQKTLELSQEISRLSWIIRKQHINLENFLTCGKEDPASYCVNAYIFDNVSFNDAADKLNSHEADFSQLIFHLRKNPKIVAHCLVEMAKINGISSINNIISTIISCFYANCVLPEDRTLVLHLMKELICYELISCDKPRRLLRLGSCAFSRMYKIFVESLTGGKLFLIAALRNPIINLLTEDLFLDIDSERAATSFPQEERLRHFGLEGTPEYTDNLKKHRDWTIQKLSSIVLKFIDGIRNNIHSFPDHLCWIIRQLYSILMNTNRINVREIQIICADLVFEYFICHAIINPELYGIIDTHINHIAQFNLMQVAQTIQVLAFSKWEEIDSKLEDLCSKFPKDCISSLLDALIDEYPDDHSPDIYNVVNETVTRTCAIASEQELIELVKFFQEALKITTNESSKQILEELLLRVPESLVDKLLNSTESQISVSNEEVNTGEPGRFKKSILNRVVLTRRKHEPQVNDSPVKPHSTCHEVLVLKFLNCNSTPITHLLNEEKFLSVEQQKKHTKVRMNLDAGSMPNEETESVVSSSMISDTPVEKRTRFSISQDQESIGTSDNLEAVSEAASNHSVTSSLDLENENINENENDNLSDMVSANVSSGRGTPNVSGRETPSSSSHSGDEKALPQLDPQVEKVSVQPRPLLSSIPMKPPSRPNNRDDIEEKFGKFNCKQLALADETKSLLSDTWSTDVLASDSEALEQSEQNTSQVSEYNSLITHPTLQAQNMFKSGLDTSETASQSDAWSTDVLSSDTERLQEFDNDDTNSFTRLEESSLSKSDLTSEDSQLAGKSEPKFMFFETECSKDGTIKYIHRSSDLPSNEKDNDLSTTKPKLPFDISDSLIAQTQSNFVKRMQTLGRLSLDVKWSPLKEEDYIYQLGKDGTSGEDEKQKSRLTDFLSIELSEIASKNENNLGDGSQESLIEFENDASLELELKKRENQANGIIDLLELNQENDSKLSGEGELVAEAADYDGHDETQRGSKVSDVLFGTVSKSNVKVNRTILRRGIDEEASRKRGFFKLPNIKFTFKEKMRSLKDKKVCNNTSEAVNALDTNENGTRELPKAESSDEILEKYREKKINKPTIRPLVHDFIPPSTFFDESVDFENTKRILRQVFSATDVQILPSAITTLTIEESNQKHHSELMKFLKSLLTEACYVGNSNHSVALQEAIRCLQLFDEKTCQKLFWSLREDYQRRSPYIAYLMKFRQNLLSTIAQLKNLLDHLSQDKKVCNYNLVSQCVRRFLDEKEKVVEHYVSAFQKLAASDEKVSLVQKCVHSLCNIMESDFNWQFANEQQMELAKEQIEQCVMSQIYLIALYPNGDSDLGRDQIIQGHMSTLQKIISPDHKYLRIPKIFHSQHPWPAAQEQILRLNAYRTPKDKVNCVVKCCTMIMNLLNLADKKSSADDLMPVLIYVLIKANPASLLSNIQYVNSFYEKKLTGEEAYCWTQFCSAVEFVKTMDYDY